MKHLGLLTALVFVSSQLFCQIIGNPIVYWDFADGIPAGFINTGPGPDAKWEYRGPDTTPDNTVCSQGSCAENFGPIQSESVENGFVIFDSAYWDDDDGFCDGIGGPYPGPHYAVLETPPIDLSLNANTILTFQQFFRHYLSSTKVLMSVDAGVTWTEIHDNGGQYIIGDFDEWVTYDITATAAGQSDVRFRFEFLGDHYWWCLDDIAVYEPFGDDIQMLSSTYTLYDGTQDPGGFGDLEYSVYPDIMLSPINVRARAKNVGIQTQTGVELQVEVSLDGAPVISNSDGPANMLPDQQRTFTVNPWIPPGIGDYEISYTITQDQTDENPENNSALRQFSVHPHEYARDEGVSKGQYLGIEQYENDEFYMGNMFESREAGLMISSIGFALGDSTTVGTTVTGRLLSLDSIDVVLAETEPYVVNAWDLNGEGDEKFVWLNFAEPVVSVDTSLYIAVLHHSGGLGERARVAQSGTPPVLTSVLGYPASNLLFYMATTPMVRLGLFTAGQTPGCTDTMAMNYDSAADIDNGSCRYPGCTSMSSTNYDPNANYDDGSCEIAGCSDPDADNYDPDVTADNGSCIYSGCTDSAACNYNPIASVDDGGCDYPEPFYDCDGICLNDFDLDGVCDELENYCLGPGCCAEGTIWDPVERRCYASDSCPADLNKDGQINTTDVLGVIGAFGTSCPQ